MIVYRVADGKGWDKNTSCDVQTLASEHAVQQSSTSTLRCPCGTRATLTGDTIVRSGTQATQDTVYVTKEYSVFTTAI